MPTANDTDLPSRIDDRRSENATDAPEKEPSIPNDVDVVNISDCINLCASADRAWQYQDQHCWSSKNKYSPRNLEQMGQGVLYPEPNCMGEGFCYRPPYGHSTDYRQTSGAGALFQAASQSDIYMNQTQGMVHPLCNDNNVRNCPDHYGKFVAESDIEPDLGYSSHSTCSSCRCEGSQVEQDLQTEKTQSARCIHSDWIDSDTEGCFHGKNEIDDLIYHFDKFFRGQIDSKMQEMQSFIHSKLTEQQIHVRHIVNTAVMSAQNSLNEETDVTCSPARKMKRWSLDYDESSSDVPSNTQSSVSGVVALGSPNTQPDDDDVFKNSTFTCLPSSFYSPAGTCSRSSGSKALSSPQVQELNQNKQCQEGTWKERVLLQLTSTACAINTMLQRPEYRT